ncbi:hypothetical protein BDN72DRAFT_677462 [Pluteus cervinus]|uniref:Uncharacterized protein n=1 Tax=Pluteus cervinus TaxID=181527 RepID=A0ACD3ASB9_9AGAR|nr:hypothetical protein BDN72DRAFT_677462 [Pluteus cervinus]
MYTAVGHPHVLLYVVYMGIEFAGIFLDPTIIPTAIPAYAHILKAVPCTHQCIRRLAIHRRRNSFYLIHISCLLVFSASFFIAIATFKSIAGFNYTHPLVLWIVYTLWDVHKLHPTHLNTFSIY